MINEFIIISIAQINASVFNDDDGFLCDVVTCRCLAEFNNVELDFKSESAKTLSSRNHFG